MEDHGYDYQPQSGGSLFLRTPKAVGSSIVIRIASKFKVLKKYWLKTPEGNRTFPWPEDEKDLPLNEKGEKPDLVEEFYWKAIQREAKTDGTLTSKPVVFQGGVGVFRALQRLNSEPEWGDPTLYDIKITREKEKGAGATSVNPLPKRMGPLTAEEQELVDKINLDDILKKSVDTSRNTGFEGGGVSRADMETVDEDTVSTENISQQEVKEVDSSENLPF